MRRRFLALPCLALVAACRAPVRAPDPSLTPAATPIHLTLLGVNDFHGSLDQAEVLAARLARARAEDPDGTLLLDAGDMWQGSLESNSFEGRPVVLLDNYLGTDAAALGNHEFDYGPTGPRSMADPSEPAAVRYGALLTRMGEMHFPLLAANVKTLESGAPRFTPSVVVTRKGVKVAVIGLATPETPDTTLRPNVAGLEFDEPAPALAAEAGRVRAAGAEVVIGIGHLGGDCPRDSDPEDSSRCKPNEEVMRLLHALPARTIDAFVGGHTHQYIANRIEGVPVIESGAYGVAFGRIDLELDPRTHHVQRSTIRHPESLEGTAVEPEVSKLLAPFRQEVAGRRAEVLARAATPITLSGREPSLLGALVTDEMLAATRRLAGLPKAEIAIQNSGGLRQPLPAGPVTYGDLYRALPFDNVLATMTPTGEELGRLFGAMLRGGRLFQVAGVTLQICGSGEATRVVPLDATGHPLEAQRRYTVVWNDFLALGGDGMKEIAREIPQTFHRDALLREVIAEALRAKREPLNAADHPLLDPSKPRVVRRPSCS